MTTKSFMKTYLDGTRVLLNEKWEYHCEDGPAFIGSDNTKYWYINGKLHRNDGPARIYSDGSIAWYLNGIHIPLRDVENWMRTHDIISWPFSKEISIMFELSFP